ncbi:hypothetical protein CEP54_015190 [Fusarium duplospermum]|uniref:Uncharacterized protein n=1 Tax=Fusarium duplospermum TaxID=1325734 RepID=A0A428NQX1_9HYPO|nr:hypothetical protein CEP54_015190 [Fusarium duplospermum]
MGNRQTTNQKKADDGKVATQPQENVGKVDQPVPPEEKVTEEKMETSREAIAQDIMEKVKEIDDRISEINERIHMHKLRAKYAEDLRDRLSEAKRPIVEMVKDLPGPESNQLGSEVILFVRLCTFMSNTQDIRVEADQFLGR